MEKGLRTSKDTYYPSTIDDGENSFGPRLILRVIDERRVRISTNTYRHIRFNEIKLEKPDYREPIHEDGALLLCLRNTSMDLWGIFVPQEYFRMV